MAPLMASEDKASVRRSTRKNAANASAKIYSASKVAKQQKSAVKKQSKVKTATMSKTDKPAELSIPVPTEACSSCTNAEAQAGTAPADEVSIAETSATISIPDLHDISCEESASAVFENVFNADPSEPSAPPEMASPSTTAPYVSILPPPKPPSDPTSLFLEEDVPALIDTINDAPVPEKPVDEPLQPAKTPTTPPPMSKTDALLSAKSPHKMAAAVSTPVPAENPNPALRNRPLTRTATGARSGKTVLAKPEPAPPPPTPKAARKPTEKGKNPVGRPKKNPNILPPPPVVPPELAPVAEPPKPEPPKPEAPKPEPPKPLTRTLSGNPVGRPKKSSTAAPPIHSAETSSEPSESIDRKAAPHERNLRKAESIEKKAEPVERKVERKAESVERKSEGKNPVGRPRKVSVPLSPPPVSSLDMLMEAADLVEKIDREKRYIGTEAADHAQNQKIEREKRNVGRPKKIFPNPPPSVASPNLAPVVTANPHTVVVKEPLPPPPISAPAPVVHVEHPSELPTPSMPMKTPAINVQTKSPTVKSTVIVTRSETSTAEAQLNERLKALSKQPDGLTIVKVETVFGEAAKTIANSRGNQQQDSAAAGVMQRMGLVQKVVQKMAPRSSVTIRQVGTSKSSVMNVSLDVPNVSLESVPSPTEPRIVEASSITEISTDEIQIIEGPIVSQNTPRIIQNIQEQIFILGPPTLPTLKPLLPALPSPKETVVTTVKLEQKTADAKEGSESPVSTDSVSKFDPVYDNLSFEDIQKAHLKGLDSDSTLTASETETVETVRQRKKVRSEGSVGRRGGTPRRDKRVAEPVSPTRADSAQSLAPTEILRSPSGQPKQKRRDSARRSSQKRNSESHSMDEASRQSFSSHQSSGLAISETKVNASELQRIMEMMDTRSPSVTLSPKKDQPSSSQESRLSYSYVDKPALERGDNKDSAEYASWITLRKKRQQEQAEAKERQESESADKELQRMRSVSLVSDQVESGFSQPAPFGPPPLFGDEMEVRPKGKPANFRRRTTLKEARQIGHQPLTDLGRWKPMDDMLLIMAVIEYRDLGLVHKQVKFSCHFTLAEVQERWFQLLYNKKIAKSACQAMRTCPPDIMRNIQRKTPFSEAEEALLAEIPFLKEPPGLETFSLLLESNRHVFLSFRLPEDLQKHWQIMVADGRIENADTFLTIPEDNLTYNSERILSFAEMEARIKDADLRDWKHVSGEFAYEMEKIQRYNRMKIMRLDKEMEHLRFLIERSLNYELPDFTRPEFAGSLEKTFLALLIGQRAKYGITSAKASFGRSSPEKRVDLDLSHEGYAGKVSRLQGYISLERNGQFRVENQGRRPVFVDSTILHYGDSCVLPDQSIVEVGDVRLQFFVNGPKVLRYLRQKYLGEFFSDEELEEVEKERKIPKTPKKPKSRRPVDSQTSIESGLSNGSSSKRSRSKVKPPLPEPMAPSEIQAQLARQSSQPPSPAKEESPMNRSPNMYMVRPGLQPTDLIGHLRMPPNANLQNLPGGQQMLRIPPGFLMDPQNRMQFQALTRSVSAPDGNGPRQVFAMGPRGVRIPMNGAPMLARFPPNTLIRTAMNTQNHMGMRLAALQMLRAGMAGQPYVMQQAMNQQQIQQRVQGPGPGGQIINNGGPNVGVGGVPNLQNMQGDMQNGMPFVNVNNGGQGRTTPNNPGTGGTGEAQKEERNV